MNRIINMKPSERIKQIREGMTGWIDPIEPIMQYLDEEYEKNKPCEHEWETSGMETFMGVKVCKKCRIISK